MTLQINALHYCVTVVLEKKMPFNKILFYLKRSVFTGMSDFCVNAYRSVNRARPRFDVSRTDLTLG